jgi:hypothetical protein
MLYSQDNRAQIIRNGPQQRQFLTFPRDTPPLFNANGYVCIALVVNLKASSAAADPGLSDARVPCQLPRKYIQPERCPSRLRD